MNLRQAFLDYCAAQPDAVAFKSASDAAACISRRELFELTHAAAAKLADAGIGKSDRVVIALPTTPAFAPWYFGAQLIGAVVVPIEPFVSERRKLAQLEYLDKLVAIARPKAMVMSEAAVVHAEEIPQFGAVFIAEALSGSEAPRALPDPGIEPGDTAHVQFSSGSTGQPKGCVLSHSAVFTNARAWCETFDYRQGEATFNWMPLFHDFGLMVGILAPVVGGLTGILLSTESFISSPTLWLKRMSGVGPVHTAGPSSAMELLRSRLAMRPRQGLALQDVRSMIWAAEPIYPQVATDFLDAVRPFGFRDDAFFAAYGMAETTVLAGGRRGLCIDHVRDIGPEIGSSVTAVAAGTHTSEFASVGRAIACAEIRIADSDGETLPERRVGHVLLRSPCLLDGYMNDRAQTDEVLQDGWLRTGDVGYLAEGELFFVTRSKDLINVAGRKIAPADVDHAVSAKLGIPVSRVACYGHIGSGATEGIVVVVESRTDDPLPLEHAAKLACYERSGVTPVAVVVCAVGSIPKTTSGKVRRQALRAQFADAVTAAPAGLVAA